MPEIEIYTTPTCPFCQRAKSLLARKGVDFKEIDVAGRPELREQMTQRAGGRHTVPQVFIDGEPMGGCDDLHELEFDGELDRLLGHAGA